MNNKLIIIGAGGHGKVVADNALKNGYTDIAFVDDAVAGECLGFPIIGKIDDIAAMDDGKTDFVLGIGDIETRKMIVEHFCVNWVNLIHPSAKIAVGVSLGKDIVIMAGAVVNAGATVGSHCIINTNAIIEHDNTIEELAHISPGVALGGTVSIGARTHVGIGATVMNNITICTDCTIGAGAVVVREITECGVYVGVPAVKQATHITA